MGANYLCSLADVNMYPLLETFKRRVDGEELTLAELTAKFIIPKSYTSFFFFPFSKQWSEFGARERLILQHRRLEFCLQSEQLW